MSTRTFLTALLALLPVLSVADVSVPDTPAGRALGAWFDAYNSDDRARVEAFHKSYALSWPPADTAQWRAETGAYDLLEVYSSDKANVFFRVKRQTTAVEEVGWLKVSESEPATIIGTWRIPPGAAVDPVSLDAARRHRLVERVAEMFENYLCLSGVRRKDGRCFTCE